MTINVSDDEDEPRLAPHAPSLAGEYAASLMQYADAAPKEALVEAQVGSVLVRDFTICEWEESLLIPTLIAEGVDLEGSKVSVITSIRNVSVLVRTAK